MNPQLLSSIILVMILSGGAYYLGKDKSATPEQKATIEANNNTIIQIGAGMVELSSEDFKAIIDGAIKDKEKLAKNAIKVVNPAKRDPEANITFNDNEELRIQNESVKAMPRFVPEPEDEEYIEDYKNIELEESERAHGVAMVRAALQAQGADECRDCGDTIPPERRKAAPWVVRCVYCQEVRERKA